MLVLGDIAHPPPLGDYLEPGPGLYIGGLRPPIFRTSEGVVSTVSEPYTMIITGLIRIRGTSHSCTVIPKSSFCSAGSSIASMALFRIVKLAIHIYRCSENGKLPIQRCLGQDGHSPPQPRWHGARRRAKYTSTILPCCGCPLSAISGIL